MRTGAIQFHIVLYYIVVVLVVFGYRVDIFACNGSCMCFFCVSGFESIFVSFSSVSSGRFYVGGGGGGGHVPPDSLVAPPDSKAS